MAIPTVFDTCTPRSDVLRDEIAEADFAADLASVVASKRSAEYRDPVRFFADTYGLIFRTLAPMRSREKMRAVIEGIEAMEREETAYWLGMAMHRPNPRRVLTALRTLLAVPKATGRRP